MVLGGFPAILGNYLIGATLNPKPETTTLQTLNRGKPAEWAVLRPWNVAKLKPLSVLASCSLGLGFRVQGLGIWGFGFRVEN